MFVQLHPSDKLRHLWDKALVPTKLLSQGQ
jgi:hypothetical protein